MYDVLKESLVIKKVSPNEYEIKLHFVVSGSTIETPFSSSLQDSFPHCALAYTHFAQEPLSYLDYDSSPLYRLLHKETLLSKIPMHSVLLSNIITHTHTSSSIALYSPVFSLSNVLFVIVFLFLF